MDALAIGDAYRRGDLATLRALLGDPGDFSNSRGPRGAGEIILEYAIYHSPLAFVRTLLELGADPNYGDSAGFPSLMAILSTTRDDRYELVELLLAYGADVHQRGVNDETPLHRAAADDDLRLIDLLLTHGADPLAQTRIDERTTPLQIAEQRGSLAAAQRLNAAAGFALAGYVAKPTALPRGWSAAPNVEELCSVSCCLTGSPDGPVEPARQNQLGFFDTRAGTRRAVPAAPGTKTGRLSVFAYRVLPRRYTGGESETAALPHLSVEPLPSSFVSLGFDVVSRSGPTFFDCSPLSCNGMAAEVAVNRCCLIDRLTDAVDVATRFSREQPEPGPYYVVEVLR